jgi:hypothetical protein
MTLPFARVKAVAAQRPLRPAPLSDNQRSDANSVGTTRAIASTLCIERHASKASTTSKKCQCGSCHLCHQMLFRFFCIQFLAAPGLIDITPLNVGKSAAL